MIVLLLNPQARSVTHADIDGSEKGIAELLEAAELCIESYRPSLKTRIRVYCDARNLERTDVPGYVIEHTGGVVQHGRCLVIGIDNAGHLTDVPYVKLTYFYEPGKGAFRIG